MITFQLIAWHDDDAPTYQIHLFGKTYQNELIHLVIDHYHPRFYVRGVTDFDAFQTFVKRHAEDATLTTVSRKSIWGFENNHPLPFIELEFTTLRAFKKLKNLFIYHRAKIPTEFSLCTLYESSIEPLLRFAHDRHIGMADWVCFDDSVVIDTVYYGTPSSVSPCQHDGIAPFVQLSFDIETYSFDGKFPDPALAPNVVFQIALIVKTYGQDTFDHKYLLHLGHTDPIDADVDLRCYHQERELLLAFRDLLLEEDPDILFHYNGDQFDWSYLYKRARFLHIEDQFALLSRLPGHVCLLSEDTFSSKSYGDSRYQRPSLPGRVNFDLLTWIQRGGEKFVNYKLDTIAHEKLGLHKDPVTAKDMFRYYKDQDAARLAVVGRYCVQDTLLVQLLVDKLNIMVEIIETSNITSVPIPYLITRGQQIKVFSLISKKAQEKGFLVPDMQDQREKGQSFTGALVIEPDIGCYWTPVAVLDFASLYPSIQIGYNICYSTIVLNPRYAHCPGIEYQDIEWDEEDGRHCSYRFAQNVDSVIPQLQRSLYLWRKQVKSQRAEVLHHLKTTNDPARLRDLELHARVLTGRQLAIKVSMNSIYGFTSAYMLFLQPLAASVTAKGRQMIEDTKRFIETDFMQLVQTPLKVIAGDTDSVFIHFPTLARPEAIALARKAQELITQRHPDPIRIEYEKVFQPLFYQTKKNYIGLKYEDDPTTPTEITYQGNAIKKSNYCNFIKTTLKHSVDLFIQKGQDGLSDVLQWQDAQMTRLIHHHVPLDELQVSTSVRAIESYVNNATGPLQLVQKMKQRDPGSAPKPGEKFYMVIVEGKGKISERTEDPEYVRDHHLRIDALYYLDKQLKEPLLKFMSLFGHDAFTAATALFNNHTQQLRRQSQGVRDIATYFTRKEDTPTHSYHK